VTCVIIYGCSKWNPVEHRLFVDQRQLVGQPLRDWETMLAYIRGTTTSTGLTSSFLTRWHVQNRAASPMLRYKPKPRTRCRLSELELHDKPHASGQPMRKPIRRTEVVS